jgi:hypothetical protein
MRSQTPFLAHRRKRWKTLFQLPNAGGRSRQGAPARDPEHRIDEQTIVLAMPSLITLFTRNEMFDPSPLLVRQSSPNQDRPPQLRS